MEISCTTQPLIVLKSLIFGIVTTPSLSLLLEFQSNELFLTYRRLSFFFFFLLALQNSIYTRVYTRICLFVIIVDKCTERPEQRKKILLHQFFPSGEGLLDWLAKTSYITFQILAFTCPQT